MSETVPVEKTSSKKIWIYIINISLIVGIVIAIVWGVRTYFNLDKDLYTNDAQIEEYINPINTRIPGYVKEVRFTEHQHIKKGDTLLIIDDREYRIQVEQAEAAYLSAQAARNVTASSVNTVQSNLTISDANIRAAEAKVWNANQNYKRFQSLLDDGAATQQQYDQVKTEYDALLAQLQALQKQRVTTGLSTQETSNRIPVNDAEIKRAHAMLEMAKLNFSYTVITAPYDGVTGRRTIQEGQFLQAGQSLLSFVRNDVKWVVANFKETQIENLTIGKKMYIKVDGFEDKKFIGEITALSQATGSRYSSVPTDNSTGNFVKVQQRIPVRIDFIVQGNKPADLELLKAGMNVEVSAAH